MKKILLAGLLGVLAMTSCNNSNQGGRSSTTGWAYNSQEWGGFEKPMEYQGQITGPNLAFIEGGWRG